MKGTKSGSKLPNEEIIVFAVANVVAESPMVLATRW